MAEYDDKMRELLIVNKYTYNTVSSIIGTHTRSYVSFYRTEDAIEKYKTIPEYINGTIFTMPGKRRDAHHYVFVSEKYSNEIYASITLQGAV